MESLGLKPSKTELQDIMNEIDSDQSGTISFDGIISSVSKARFFSNVRAFLC